MRVHLLVLLFSLSFLALGSCDIAQDVLSMMDWTVDPCQDFYSFSCGGWIKNFTLPSDKSHYVKGFGSIEDANDKILEQIVHDESHIYVSAFFQSCLNLTHINAAGPTPIVPYLALIEKIQSIDDFSLAIALFHSNQFPALFQFTVDIDPKNPPINIIQLQQGGLGLPDYSYYSSQDTLKAYLNHIEQMLTLMGLSDASQVAVDALNFEIGLSQITIPGNNLTNPFDLYNPVDSQGLKVACPSFNWDSYFNALTANASYGVINLITPSFFTNLGPYLFKTPVSVLRNYLKWLLVHNTASLLSTPFVDENFKFYGTFLGGVKQQPPRWKSCVAAVDGDLGDVLGLYYARIAFSGSSKTVAQDMVNQIEQAMTNTLKQITWMDDETRAKALEKISLIANYIGYPDHLRNYSFNIGNDFFTNVLTASQIAFSKSVKKIGQPEDKSIWSMTADTINAYYDPPRNEMVFPAAILQVPYFDVSRPPPMNYGGAGMIMGHELTHGFDSMGRDYDGTGKLINWWQPQTSEEFNQRVQCVIDQYSKFEVLPGVFIDGKLTQGENVADMGGIKNAFNAYMNTYGSDANKPSIVPGLTNIQLLFVSFAQGWCAVATDQYLANQVKVDPHSWAKFRVLGALMNLPNFSETWPCSAGTYMNPPNRCTVW